MGLRLGAAAGALTWVDVTPVVLVIAVGQQEAWAPAPGFATTVHPRAAMAAAYLVAAAALLVRRRYPLAVVGAVNVVLGLLFVTSGAPDGLGDVLAPLVALYSAGRYAARRRLPLAVALTAAGVFLHERFDPRFVFDGRAVTVWCVIAAAGVLGYLFRLRGAQLHRALQEGERLEHARVEEARAARVAERAHIARELHDLVGHGMSIAVLQIGAAQTNLDAGDVAGARARLAQVERTTRQTLEEMRRLLVMTADDGDGAPLAPQPGLADLDELVVGLRAAGADVSLDVAVHNDVPAGVGLTAYRVVQEALTNVIRHARASARVLVSEHDNGLLVEVLDDGQQRPDRLAGGRGIVGMRERVVLYDGRFDISMRPEGGVRVSAWMPLSVGS